jgi:hypothetical protein
MAVPQRLPTGHVDHVRLMLVSGMTLASGMSLQVGRHIVTREGPITRVAIYGEITYDNIQKFLSEYEAMIDEQGFVLIMMEMREGGEMAMPGRRLATEWGSKQSERVRSAIFGASFFLRTGIELLNRAAFLMTGNAPKITFVRTYEEARAWLLAEIPKLPPKRAS